MAKKKYVVNTVTPNEMSTIFYCPYIFQSYYQGIIVATRDCFDLVVTLLQLVRNLWSRDIHGFPCLACIKSPRT